MFAMPKGRKGKAFTLVPLALISAAWTASLAGVNPAVAGQEQSTALPGGATVPSEAIKAPASVPIPGAIAPSVPDGTADSVVAGASTSGIPSAALSAYQRGAQIINAADPTCNVPWELLAAIGRVESNHGQYDGNILNSDGVSTPGIYGPQLNGKNGTQAITDTDGGELDKDAVYDRAVGPMQFIPSTWSSVKVDADGDGERNPQDIDDASLASGVYLCSGPDDMSTRKGQEASIFRYNHSREYVDLVLRIMEAYSQGEYTSVPSGTYGGTVFTPSYTSVIKKQRSESKPAKSPSTAPSVGITPGTEPETDNGGGGDDGDKPAKALPKTPLSPIVDPVVEVVTGATQPVVDLLEGLTAALGFCNSQFAKIPDPLNLLQGAKSKCAAKVEGMEKSDAAALIPNTLNGILKWLGLVK